MTIIFICQNYNGHRKHLLDLKVNFSTDLKIQEQIHLEVKQIHEQITLSEHTSQVPVYEQNRGKAIRQIQNTTYQQNLPEEYRTMFSMSNKVHRCRS